MNLEGFTQLKLFEAWIPKTLRQLPDEENITTAEKHRKKGDLTVRFGYSKFNIVFKHVKPFYDDNFSFQPLIYEKERREGYHTDDLETQPSQEEYAMVQETKPLFDKIILKLADVAEALGKGFKLDTVENLRREMELLPDSAPLIKIIDWNKTTVKLD